VVEPVHCLFGVGLVDVVRWVHLRVARALMASPVPANRAVTRTAATICNHGVHRENRHATAFARITTAAGPYSTSPSRLVIALRTQPSQTPRARPAACATLTSTTATTAAIGRSHQPGTRITT